MAELDMYYRSQPNYELIQQLHRDLANSVEACRTSLAELEDLNCYLPLPKSDCWVPLIYRVAMHPSLVDLLPELLEKGADPRLEADAPPDHESPQLALLCCAEAVPYLASHLEPLHELPEQTYLLQSPEKLRALLEARLMTRDQLVAQIDLRCWLAVQHAIYQKLALRLSSEEITRTVYLEERAARKASQTRTLEFWKHLGWNLPESMPDLLQPLVRTYQIELLQVLTETFPELRLPELGLEPPEDHETLDRVQVALLRPIYNDRRYAQLMEMLASA